MFVSQAIARARGRSGIVEGLDTMLHRLHSASSMTQAMHAVEGAPAHVSEAAHVKALAHSYRLRQQRQCLQLTSAGVVEALCGFHSRREIRGLERREICGLERRVIRGLERGEMRRSCIKNMTLMMRCTRIIA